MYNYVGRSHNTLLIIVFITTLCLRCYGAISSIPTTNWTNAYINCRKEGKLLPNIRINISNDAYFWTGHYTRISGWIKIIGCFEEGSVNSLTKKTYQMQFPSAGRCQEVCLASNYSVFGVQVSTCVCLGKIPRHGSREANDCSLSCPGNNAAETIITFQNDCGGHQTYNIFKSGSEMENSAFTAHNCISIQCGDIKFIGQECFTSITRICKETLYSEYNNWQSSSTECKSNNNSYLLGDIDLTEPTKACELIQGKPLGPSWIGIAKEVYMSKAEDNDDMIQTERNPIECLKCNSKNCTSADCKEFNNYVCIERPGTTSTTSTGTTTRIIPHGTFTTSIRTSSTGTTTRSPLHRTVSTSTTPTGITISSTPSETDSAPTSPTGNTKCTFLHVAVSTEHSTLSIFKATEGSTSKKKESMINKQDGNTTAILIVVPVTVIVILGLSALLFVIFWRRQIKKTTETKHAQHEPSSPNHPEKSDINHSFQNNYFVLDKTETYSVVNSVNHAKDKGRKISNKECNDDDYDHLGENVREEVEEEDNYHHAFFPSNEDESDYGTCIRNMSAECLMENPYSHTKTGELHVTLEDNEYNTVSIIA